MKRRDFLFTVALVVPTSRAIAEQRTTLKHVAVVVPATMPSDISAIIFEEMQRFGYVEGANLDGRTVLRRGSI